jgi:hypothetical protein
MVSSAFDTASFKVRQSRMPTLAGAPVLRTITGAFPATATIYLRHECCRGSNEAHHSDQNVNDTLG